MIMGTGLEEPLLPRARVLRVGAMLEGSGRSLQFCCALGRIFNEWMQRGIQQLIPGGIGLYVRYSGYGRCHGADGARGRGPTSTAPLSKAPPC